MKMNFRILSGLLAASALTGCAAPTARVSQSVGPDLARPRVNLSKGQGSMMVYTALDVPPDLVNAYFPTHSAYSICSEDGKPLRRVDNRSGGFYQTPAAVSLPAGNYKVQGRATNSGLVTVPVIIREGKTTIVDLEGATLPQRRPTGAGQWIRLPDGQVIGARAE